MAAAVIASQCASAVNVASLGDFRVESGGVIRNCRITYRTFGRLDAAKSNAVLITTPFQGTSGDLAPRIGPGRLVDSSRYFVVAIDALGNGVASSPSNTDLKPGEPFPPLSVRDMVETQHRLLTKHLGIMRLKAVVGESMGGMQAFQWATAYPDFAEKVVAIVGSPQSRPDDRHRWRTAVANLRAVGRVRRAVRSLWKGSLRQAIDEVTIDRRDYAAQADAIASFDVASPYGGSLAAAARTVRASLFIAFVPGDELVNPAPAVEFAHLTNAALLQLNGRCGHQAPSCERKTLWPAVTRFLAR